MRAWDAPHPNAARVFIDFMMSDAQHIIQENNEYSLRTDVKPPTGMPSLAELKTMPLDVDARKFGRRTIVLWSDLEAWSQWRPYLVRRPGAGA